MLILPSSYLAPIAHYALIQQNPSYFIDGKEHFIKQSYRNRALIYAANGPLPLTIPLQKYSHRDCTESIQIAYTENWQILHWRSFESAYRNSAFFEFYEDDLKSFYENQQIENLMEFNAKLESTILELMRLNAKVQRTDQYHEQEPDWRLLLSPKNKRLIEEVNFPFYQQVFNDEGQFHANLSIVDLLFNLGPASTNYLKELKFFDNQSETKKDGEKDRPGRKQE